MARPVWSGSVTFGLVSLPVSLAAATESHTVRFHQLQRGTSDRVRSKRVNERTGREVPYDEIVKGYEIRKGEYVTVEPEELDEVTPGRSETIEITGFVELEAIPPIYFGTTYYLQPREESDAKVYALLRDVLEETGRAGIATMSMHQKDHLVAVHCEDGVLVLHTLQWPDEVRDPRSTLDHLPAGSTSGAGERKMARRLIETMATDFEPEDHHDRTEERIRDLVDAKDSGTEAGRSEPAPQPTNVVDLTETLRRSVDAAGGPKSGKKNGKRSGRKKGGREGHARKADGGEPERLSKAELYRRAADAGVSGRSKMNRAQLRAALERTGRAA